MKWSTGAQYYWKREPGWTNLRGMWGKRSVDAGAASLDGDHGNACADCAPLAPSSALSVPTMLDLTAYRRQTLLY